MLLMQTASVATQGRQIRAGAVLCAVMPQAFLTESGGARLHQAKERERVAGLLLSEKSQIKSSGGVDIVIEIYIDLSLPGMAPLSGP